MSARVLARVGVCATLTFLGATGAGQLWTAHAQSGYPNRPVTLVVPYPAGGTADLLCRFAADKASSNLAGQVVVENRPGGNGNLHYEHETSAGADVIDAALAGGVNTAAVGGAVAAPQTVKSSPQEKIGRNDPCWCGSGKKFKKCHGA